MSQAKWSVEEVDAAYEKHRSLRRAARALGCSPQYVWNRLTRAGRTKFYGKPFATRTQLTAGQAKAAWAQIERGKSLKKVAIGMRLSPDTLRRELDVMGIRPKLPPVEKTDWSDAEILIVERHYKKDLSAAQIAAVLGRSRNEVIGKAYRMGL